MPLRRMNIFRSIYRSAIARPRMVDRNRIVVEKVEEALI